VDILSFQVHGTHKGGGLENRHSISVTAARVLPLSITRAETKSHDFH
jgi:hypothetical protein